MEQPTDKPAAASNDNQISEQSAPGKVTAEAPKPPEQPPAESTEATAVDAALAKPTIEPEKQPSGPTWPETPEDHPLSKLFAQLSAITSEAEYSEAYGVDLSSASDFHKKLILQKFLRANANDVDKAKAQLTSTLKWRKEFQPLKAVDETFSKERFGGLGYVTTLDSVPESVNQQDIATFNIYGAVKDPKLTFEDIDGFLKWRVGLMEVGISKLNLSGATQPIPDHGKGPDPYQGIQIHDYLNVSFLRQNTFTKAASKKAIEVFQDHYPEMLSRKFFVNVPIVMGWMFAAMKMFLAKETVKKFTVLSYGNQLASELGQSVPEVYGGKGGALETAGKEMKLEQGP